MQQQRASRPASFLRVSLRRVQRPKFATRLHARRILSRGDCTRRPHPRHQHHKTTLPTSPIESIKISGRVCGRASASCRARASVERRCTSVACSACCSGWQVAKGWGVRWGGRDVGKNCTARVYAATAERHSRRVRGARVARASSGRASVVSPHSFRHSAHERTRSSTASSVKLRPHSRDSQRLFNLQ